MRFNRVEVTHFRNLTSTAFTPSPSLNLIYGDNGSGKSSLLEAIHYLATGSSFRTHKLTNLINQQSECFTLYSLIGEDAKHRIGLQRCRDLKHTTRIDGRDINRRSELVQLLPLQVISPESISLLIEGSELRRNFIDWSLFHVEQSFHFHLSHYMRALKQRNALLKQGNITDLSHWDIQLHDHGEVIDRLRRNYVDAIAPYITQLMQQLLPEVMVTLHYRSGFGREIDLRDALSHTLENDIKMRFTTSGPHRADLVVKTEHGKAAESLSRGQLKLTVIAFKLAQIILLQRDSARKPVILIDDIAAELDVKHRALLMDTIHDLGSQLFITSPELGLIEHDRWDEKKVFHVEHGQIKEMV